MLIIQSGLEKIAQFNAPSFCNQTVAKSCGSPWLGL